MHQPRHPNLPQHLHVSSFSFPLLFRFSFLQKRRFILAEVQETERDYVTDLSTIIQGYKHPLIGVLSDSDIQSVFGNLEDLYKFHKQFLKKVPLRTIREEKKRTMET